MNSALGQHVNSCNARRARHEISGFTLLETLVGLTLLGVMLILIYSALNVGLRAWDTGEKRVAEASRQRVVQSFLRRDLGQIFPVRWRGIPESKIAFEGAKDEIKFVTMLTLGAAAREGGMQWVHLYVADGDATDGERKRTLFVKRSGFNLQAKDWEGIDAAKPVALIDGVKSFELAYYGAENDTTEAQWTPDWTNALRMPQLIKLTLQVENGRDAPPLIVSLRLGEEAGCYDNAFQRQCGPRRA
ncbi:MAG: type II secretion system protein GspJ [Usitatibacteraceae bacterium]